MMEGVQFARYRPSLRQYPYLHISAVRHSISGGTIFPGQKLAGGGAGFSAKVHQDGIPQAAAIYEQQFRVVPYDRRMRVPGPPSGY